jgi:hypothetical protein
MRPAACLLLLACSACHDDPAGLPDGGGPIRDLSLEANRGDRDPLDARDLGALDLAPPRELATAADLAKPDLASKPDLAKPDLAKPDLAKPDLAKPDLAKPDLAKPDAKNPTGLTVPCKQGPGWTLFRFHYGGGSPSPTIDVWDASCSYSLAPGSACNIYAVYPGFGSVSYTSQGYPILTTTEYLRVRFSVSGLSFSKATVHLQARSYATSSSTSFRVWSPISGEAIGGPVDNDWTYDWYALDWSGHLTPSDPPSLTAIQIYAHQGSGQLAVQSVELCVQ